MIACPVDEDHSCRKGRRVYPKGGPNATCAVFGPSLQSSTIESLMDWATLQGVLEAGEGPQVEYKRILPSDGRAVRPLCAFANTRGGWLLIGVTDEGRIHGLHHPEAVARHLLLLGRGLIEPPLEPHNGVISAHVVDCGGPKVVAVRVERSDEIPHAIVQPDGSREIVVRVGAANRAADGPTLTRLRRGPEPTLRVSQLAPLERTALEWIRRHARSDQRPSGDATVARFAKAKNIGQARAQRVFTRLETLGLVVGHGAERTRVYVATQ